MSEGGFLTAGYEAGDGTVHAIRIQPETASLVVNGVTNTIPAQPAGGYVQPQAKVSGGKGQIGLTARRVGIKFGTTPPAGFSTGSTIYLPWLQADTFPQFVPRGAAVTYRGASGTFIGISPERFR